MAKPTTSCTSQPIGNRERSRNVESQTEVCRTDDAVEEIEAEYLELRPWARPNADLQSLRSDGDMEEEECDMWEW